MNTIEITSALEQLAKCTVWHPDFDQAKRLIMKSIATTRERKDPASALLTGKTGVGKTRLCGIIEQDFGAAYLADTDIFQKQVRPCIYVEVQANATLKSVSGNILAEIIKTPEQLANPPAAGAIDEINKAHEKLSLAQILTMITRRLHSLETQLLILDEFHHVTDRGQEATKLSICNWLTNLLNQSMKAILLSGSETILTIVNSVPELSSRYPYRATLREHEYCPEADAPIFLSILAGLEKEMIRLGKLEHYIHLTDPKLYRAIYLATHGNFRALSDLLNDSFKIALVRDDKILKTEDFIEAYADLHASEHNDNPFQKSAKEIESIILTMKW
ncbi:TPA: TniB family NTP-binding protein [Pseudomonas aeruginosa]|nr:TniB family NTP-binding protein [Pseudomonas aeruginosa]HCF6119512.1 TniB family NTP-binding protein [Pseudomonas aeruginosa]